MYMTDPARHSVWVWLHFDINFHWFSIPEPVLQVSKLIQRWIIFNLIWGYYHIFMHSSIKKIVHFITSGFQLLRPNRQAGTMNAGSCLAFVLILSQYHQYTQFIGSHLNGILKYFKIYSRKSVPLMQAHYSKLLICKPLFISGKLCNHLWQSLHGQPHYLFVTCKALCLKLWNHLSIIFPISIIHFFLQKSVHLLDQNTHIFIECS